MIKSNGNALFIFFYFLLFIPFRPAVGSTKIRMKTTSTLILCLGENKTISAQGASAIWIENRQILQATPQGSGLLLKALKIGDTILRLGNSTQKVQVIHPSQADSVSRLQKIVRKTIGLRADFVRGQLALGGNLYRLEDWQKIANQELSYQMQAKFSDELQQKAQAFFNAQLKKEKLPRQNLIFSNALEIRIHPKSIYRQKYETIFSPYGVAVILDEDSLEFAPTVKVQITIAEIRRDATMSFGIDWPKNFQATLLSTKKDVLSNLIFGAGALEKRGMGKILASPNILCRSGKEAEFLAGGEFPIKIANYRRQDIIWKKYGVLLKVKPKADATGRMSISIDTEISTLDSAQSVEGIPGILTNHVSSHFDLNKPQTIALSGMIKSEESKNVEGLPFLSRLPILGALFSSQEFRDNRTELVIFVRPTVVEDESDPETTGNNQLHLGQTQWK